MVKMIAGMGWTRTTATKHSLVQSFSARPVENVLLRDWFVMAILIVQTNPTSKVVKTLYPAKAPSFDATRRENAFQIDGSAMASQTVGTSQTRPTVLLFPSVNTMSLNVDLM